MLESINCSDKTHAYLRLQLTNPPLTLFHYIQTVVSSICESQKTDKRLVSLSFLFCIGWYSEATLSDSSQMEIVTEHLGATCWLDMSSKERLLKNLLLRNRCEENKWCFISQFGFWVLDNPSFLFHTLPYTVTESPRQVFLWYNKYKLWAVLQCGLASPHPPHHQLFSFQRRVESASGETCRWKGAFFSCSGKSHATAWLVQQINRFLLYRGRCESLLKQFHKTTAFSTRSPAVFCRKQFCVLNWK